MVAHGHLPVALESVLADDLRASRHVSRPISLGSGALSSQAQLTPHTQIAVSLISDLVPPRFVPVAESLLYVGVYIGEAVSAHLSAVFKSEGKTWRLAFEAIGIVGIVVAVLTRLIIFEPVNRRQILLVGGGELGLLGRVLTHKTKGAGGGGVWRGRKFGRV